MRGWRIFMEEMLTVPEHEKVQEQVPPLTHVEAN
jgi:hypothetical protein